MAMEITAVASVFSPIAVLLALDRADSGCRQKFKWGREQKGRNYMSRKYYLMGLAFAGALSLGSLCTSQVEAFPTNAAAIKGAMPDNIIDVRGGRGGGSFRGGAGGFRGGGGR